MTALKTLRLSACAVILLTLSACQTASNIADNLAEVDPPSYARLDPTAHQLLLKGSCPSSQTAPDLESVSEFSSSADMTDDNKMTSAHIIRVASTCVYNNHSLQVDLELTFEGQLGPHGRQNEGDAVAYTHPFFVAITSPGGRILAKEVFNARLSYEDAQNTAFHQEKIRQLIPLTDPDKGKDYVVLTGFQMHPSQLEYNRAQARLRAAQEKAQSKAAARHGTTVSAAPQAPSPTAHSTTPIATIEREEITTIKIETPAPIQLAPEHENVQKTKP